MGSSITMLASTAQESSSTDDLRLPTAETLVKELAAQTAIFKLLPESQTRLISLNKAVQMGNPSVTGPCYARIGSIQHPTPPALKKIEHYSVHKVIGDGRCLFRALAIGMAINDGAALNSTEEQESADELRRSVMEAICTDKNKRNNYEDALIAITMEESINKYCGRIRHPSFWGGESELLVLSRMYEQPIIVYLPENEATGIVGRWGTGFIPIAEYGRELLKASAEHAACKPVRLLYSGGNHYDLLI